LCFWHIFQCFHPQLLFPHSFCGSLRKSIKVSMYTEMFVWRVNIKHMKNLYPTTELSQICMQTVLLFIYIWLPHSNKPAVN
jgi:hypothetical protein